MKNVTFQRNLLIAAFVILIGYYIYTKQCSKNKSAQSVPAVPSQQISNTTADQQKIVPDPLISKVVTLYTGSNYRGQSVAQNEGDYALPTGIPNNSIQSVKVAPGLQVTLYKDINFQGESITLKLDTPDLPQTWIQATNSWKISNANL